jgi:UDP-N-acetylglucosamine 2-epimerase (non-hydrolysing)
MSKTDFVPDQLVPAYASSGAVYPDREQHGDLFPGTERSQINILSVFGTRPEAIKLAPVIAELDARTETDSRVCVTGQHRDMLDQALDIFGIIPHYDLDLMQKGQTPTRVAALALQRLEPVFERAHPDWVLVHGDTTTAAAAAMAACYAGIKVGHVEAGLRSHNKWQPFPEETNRRMVSVMADFHFAPTESARQNLLREGIAESDVIVTGNTVIDALHWVQRMPAKRNVFCGPLSRLAQSAARLVLVTAHRRENFGEPIVNICQAIRRLAQSYGDDILLCYPVHPNPKISEPVHRILGGLSNVVLCPPLEYMTLVQVMKRAYLVLTDSGGLQEEAPALGVPALVLRDVTERPEAVAAGTVKLIGTERDRIISEVVQLLDDHEEHDRMAHAVSPYGDGHAAERIVAALIHAKK